MEHIREGQRMLEASTSRREKLEAALRSKLEKQVRNLRAEIIHLKGELGTYQTAITQPIHPQLRDVCVY